MKLFKSFANFSILKKFEIKPLYQVFFGSAGGSCGSFICEEGFLNKISIVVLSTIGVAIGQVVYLGVKSLIIADFKILGIKFPKIKITIRDIIQVLSKGIIITIFLFGSWTIIQSFILFRIHWSISILIIFLIINALTTLVNLTSIPILANSDTSKTLKDLALLLFRLILCVVFSYFIVWISTKMFDQYLIQKVSHGHSIKWLYNLIVYLESYYGIGFVALSIGGIGGIFTNSIYAEEQAINTTKA